MATRTLVRLRSGYRIPLNKNEGAMMEHMLLAIIRESIQRADRHDAETYDAVMVVIKEEIEHVAQTMDERYVRHFARHLLNLIVEERIRRDFEQMQANESGTIQ